MGLELVLVPEMVLELASVLELVPGQEQVSAVHKPLMARPAGLRP